MKHILIITMLAFSQITASDASDMVIELEEKCVSVNNKIVDFHGSSEMVINAIAGPIGRINGIQYRVSESLNWKYFIFDDIGIAVHFFKKNNTARVFTNIKNTGKSYDPKMPYQGTLIILGVKFIDKGKFSVEYERMGYEKMVLGKADQVFFLERKTNPPELEITIEGVGDQLGMISFVPPIYRDKPPVPIFEVGPETHKWSN